MPGGDRSGVISCIMPFQEESLDMTDTSCKTINVRDKEAVKALPGLACTAQDEKIQTET